MQSGVHCEEDQYVDQAQLRIRNCEFKHTEEQISINIQLRLLMSLVISINKETEIKTIKHFLQS